MPGTGSSPPAPSVETSGPDEAGAGHGGGGGRPPRESRATRLIPGHQHADYRRAVRIGMLVSLVVHAVLIFFISRSLVIPRPDYAGPLVRRPPPAEGLEVVETQPTEAPPEAVTEPRAPQRQPPTEEPPPEEEEEGRPVPAEGAETEAPLTNAEKLRPRQGDPRLWVTPDETEGMTLDGMARADSALRAVLREYLDSLQLTAEQRRAARRWTFGEGDQEWGISPEGIHLGDVTIPLPVGQIVQPAGPVRRELERKLRDLELIQRQEALQSAEETREERIEAMRERSREQAEESSESDSTGTEESGG